MQVVLWLNVEKWVLTNWGKSKKESIEEYDVENAQDYKDFTSYMKENGSMVEKKERIRRSRISRKKSKTW